MVTGPLGGSILGNHLDFTPRVREALALHDAADLHAMIDLSDGLAADLHHVCEESRCGAVLFADAIPITAAARNSPAATAARRWITPCRTARTSSWCSRCRPPTASGCSASSRCRGSRSARVGETVAERLLAGTGRQAQSPWSRRATNTRSGTGEVVAGTMGLMGRMVLSVPFVP